MKDITPDCAALLKMLTGTAGYVNGADALSLAENLRRYRREWREEMYPNGIYREAENKGLIELYVFGRGLNRQCRWKLTDAGQRVANGSLLV